MVTNRVFGSIPNIPAGAMFNSRQELSLARVHRPTVAGISGSSKQGCDSIVLNGGYVDDEDYGDLIIYTGEGGQDPSGRQVRNQQLTRGNLALKISCDEGYLVRVSRGPRGAQLWSPSIGYRYDGLYLVIRYWPDRGIHGYRIWRYRLERVDQSQSIEANSQGPALRHAVTADRLIRDAALAQKVKEIHDFTCQVCGERLESPGGPYAEAAHIKPLGRPDDGPDVESNILCVCPNHHKLLDNGGIVVDEAWRIIHVVDGRVLGQLTLNSKHRLTQDYVRWHRERWLGT